MAVTAGGLAAAILLNGCLTRPEPSFPSLPALPVTSVEVAELPPLAGPSANVDALLQVLPYRQDAAWYDELQGALQRLAQDGEALAPVPALLDALADGDPAIRRGASFVLAAMSNRLWRDQPAELAPALIAAANDEDALIRENALRAMVVARPFGSVEPILLAALDDPEPRIRWAAARSLSPWRISNAALPALADSLEDSDIRVRVAAAFVLGLHEDGPALALPDILRNLGDADPNVRSRAAEQIQFFAGSLDVDALPSVVTGDDTSIPKADLPSWSDPRHCVNPAEFSIGGLRPWNSEQRVRVALGEPDRIVGGRAEDDSGPAPVYRYEYPDMQVDLFRDRVEKLTTTSGTVSIGDRIHIGMTRQEVFAAVFEIEPPPEALAARRFELPDCELPAVGDTLSLDFDQNGRLWRAEMYYFVP